MEVTIYSYLTRPTVLFLVKISSESLFTDQQQSVPVKSC